MDITVGAAGTSGGFEKFCAGETDISDASRPIDAEGHKQAEWRTDPDRAGQSAVLADIGVHAFSLACFVSGCEAEAVAASIRSAVVSAAP